MIDLIVFSESVRWIYFFGFEFEFNLHRHFLRLNHIQVDEINNNYFLVYIANLEEKIDYVLIIIYLKINSDSSLNSLIVVFSMAFLICKDNGKKMNPKSKTNCLIFINKAEKRRKVVFTEKEVKFFQIKKMFISSKQEALHFFLFEILIIGMNHQQKNPRKATFIILDAFIEFSKFVFKFIISSF